MRTSRLTDPRLTGSGAIFGLLGSRGTSAGPPPGLAAARGWTQPTLTTRGWGLTWGAEAAILGSVGDDLILDSLRRRVRALHSLYTDAVGTMTLEQVNHFEREGVVPIAFSLFHIVNMIDASLFMLTGTGPIWDAAWEARVKPAIADHGKHRSVAEMVNQRIGDYEAFQEYLHAVFGRVEAWLEDLEAAELTRVVVKRPFPEQIASTFSARVAGEEGITVLDAVECWIYQHGLRHMGEIELARGLVGLSGMTS
jgi:hypothetical protein